MLLHRRAEKISSARCFPLRLTTALCMYVLWSSDSSKTIAPYSQSRLTAFSYTLMFPVLWSLLFKYLKLVSLFLYKKSSIHSRSSWSKMEIFRGLWHKWKWKKLQPNIPKNTYDYQLSSRVLKDSLSRRNLSC